jgi:hypothetical protein
VLLHRSGPRRARLRRWPTTTVSWRLSPNRSASTSAKESEDFAREIQSHIANATAAKPAVGSANLRRALELPEPAVTYNNAEWVLLDDCRCAALDGFIVTAKRGFKTDLASIPRLLWGFIASFELSLVAPIVHDLIYGSAGTVTLPDGEVTPADKRFDRKEADDLFLELMTRSKVAYWKRNVAYLAVRAFGGSSWRQG